MAIYFEDGSYMHAGRRYDRHGNLDPTYVPAVTVKTQKARGVRVIAEHGIGGGLSPDCAQRARIAPNESRPPLPFFARPCPARPRHGFVDSRLVKTQEEWEALVAEVIASGEETWEILCMPFIKAEWSAIVTPAGITFGPGHDGATSGHGAVMVPAQTADHAFDSAFRLDRGRCGIKESPYVEIVHGTYDKPVKAGQQKPRAYTHAVQIRDGPIVVLADRFVPSPMTVQNVVMAGGDLMEWEAKAKTFPPGTVVWHPGGSLSSHYAVHAVVNGFAVLCTPEPPKVGDRLKPVGPRKMRARDYKALARYVMTYLKAGPQVLAKSEADFKANHGYLNDESEVLRPMVGVCIATLHAQGQWGPEDHLLRLRAFAAANIFRASAGACLGELRHFNCDENSPKAAGVKMSTDWAKVKAESHKGGRGGIQKKCMTLDPATLSSLVRASIKDFNAEGWDEGMGGSAWADCAEATTDLGLALSAFVLSPSAKTWAKVINRWNGVINVSHNNDKMLTKYVSTTLLEESNIAPAAGLINPWTVTVVMESVPKARTWTSTVEAWYVAAGGVLPPKHLRMVPVPMMGA